MTQTWLSTGRYDVTFVGLGGTANVGQEGIQIAQRTGIGGYCGIVSWRYAGQDLVVTVQCQRENGTGPEDHDFRILVLK